MIPFAEDGLIHRMAHAEIIGIDEQNTSIVRIPQYLIRLAGARHAVVLSNLA